jgi:hypothetical protein
MTDMFLLSEVQMARRARKLDLSNLSQTTLNDVARLMNIRGDWRLSPDA